MSAARSSAVYSAAVLGASGNVGGMLVSSLLKMPEFGRVILLNRRELEAFKGNTKVEQRIVPMEAEKLEAASLAALEGVDVAFITMGVGAPSKSTKEELELVDVTLPTEFAQSAKAAGVRHLSILTSVGADVNAKPSSLTGTAAGGGLTLHLKGKVEENMKSLDFESTAIFRPGALIGSSKTPGIVNWIGPKMNLFLPDRFRSIQITTLGEAMAACALKALNEGGNAPKVQILEGSAIPACVGSEKVTS